MWSMRSSGWASLNMRNVSSNTVLPPRKGNDTLYKWSPTSSAFRGAVRRLKWSVLYLKMDPVVADTKTAASHNAPAAWARVRRAGAIASEFIQ